MRVLPLFLACLAGTASAQTVAPAPDPALDKAIVPETVADLSRGVHVITGVFNNTTVVEGPRGLVVVDTQFAPRFPAIRAAIRQVSPKPVLYVINTHYHYDHTGGNAAFHAEGARILAQANLVKARWVATSVTARSEAELDPLFEDQGLPSPIISVQTESALSMITVAAATDLLAMLPQQWLSFVKTTRLLTPIRLDEPLVAPAICIVHRAKLPLTPAAEHLRDLFCRSALNQHAPPA